MYSVPSSSNLTEEIIENWRNIQALIQILDFSFCIVLVSLSVCVSFKGQIKFTDQFFGIILLGEDCETGPKL